jgi:hypothetical protein
MGTFGQRGGNAARDAAQDHQLLEASAPGTNDGITHSGGVQAVGLGAALVITD